LVKKYSLKALFLIKSHQSSINRKTIIFITFKHQNRVKIKLHNLETELHNLETELHNLETELHKFRNR